MQENLTMQQGWDFAVRLLGGSVATQVGSGYIAQINSAIDDFTKSMINLKSNQTDAVLGGYAAEHWHANTFNINAVAAQSNHRATTVQSTDFASVDIDTNFLEKYSSKYFSTAEKSVNAQAAFASELGHAKYLEQDRIVPSDQLIDAIEIAHRKSLKNIETRPDVSLAYKETTNRLTDRIADEKGVESLPLTKEDSMKLANDIKNDTFDLKNYNVNINNSISRKYMLTQSIKAGRTAATIAVILQIAPEIYKAIDFLIKTGEIDINQVKQMGSKAITTGASSFIKGTIAASLFISCYKGSFGVALQSINSTVLGVMVTITLETVKNALLTASGHLTSKQMTVAFVDTVAVSLSFVAASKIGGVIGQTIGFQAPAIGYIIGSLIGCAFSVVYNIGKNKFISFCADTGFSCFGLVEQDYTLPESVLNQIGISTIPIKKNEIKHTSIARNDFLEKVNHLSLETINITMVRRGVIGINKVGYVF